MHCKYMKGSWGFANLTYILFGFIEALSKIYNGGWGVSASLKSTKCSQLWEPLESLCSWGSRLEDLEGLILEAYIVCISWFLFLLVLRILLFSCNIMNLLVTDSFQIFSFKKNLWTLVVSCGILIICTFFFWNICGCIYWINQIILPTQ